MRVLVATPLALVSELTLEAQYRVPHGFKAGAARVELETLAVRLGAGWITPVSSRSSVYAWLGAGPDAISYRTTEVERDADLRASPEGRRLHPSAALTVGMGLGLSRDVSLRMEGRLDAPLYRAQYTIGSSTQASAWRLQPGMFIAIDTSRTRP